MVALKGKSMFVKNLFIKFMVIFSSILILLIYVFFTNSPLFLFHTLEGSDSDSYLRSFSVKHIYDIPKNKLYEFISDDIKSDKRKYLYVNYFRISSVVGLDKLNERYIDMLDLQDKNEYYLFNLINALGLIGVDNSKILSSKCGETEDKELLFLLNRAIFISNRGTSSVNYCGDFKPTAEMLTLKKVIQDSIGRERNEDEITTLDSLYK